MSKHYTTSPARASKVLTCFVIISIVGTCCADEYDFNTEILPLLSDRCFKCHGPDEATREAGLRLDQREDAIAELDSGNMAIVPGNLDESAFVDRITSDDPDTVMPPPDSGKQLNSEEMAALKSWIQSGAEYAQHWAFHPPKRPIAPEVKDTEWVLNPIDQFVLARLEEGGIIPNPPADRETLARRVGLDLIGMSASPDLVDEFLADVSSDAYQRLLDRLFESPHYGEHMAVNWLDAARYADTNGYQNDFRRNMWPWRDWVIQAYNDKMPFDQFVIEQIAGDLLPNPTLNQKVATGFNRNNRTVTENGSIEQEWHVENVIDRVETTATAILGLTMGCARCHDHKFDPISQRDFYQFYAFFNNVNEKGVYFEQRGNVPPLVSLPTEEQKETLGLLTTSITDLRRKESELLDAQRRAVDEIRSAINDDDETIVPVPAVTIALTNQSIDAVAQNRASVPRVQSTGKITWKSGLLGAVASFDGTTALEYINVFEPSANLPFSIVAWIRFDEGGTVFSKLGDLSERQGFELRISPEGHASVRLSHTSSDSELSVVSKQPLPKKQWMHLALNYDGSSKARGISLYIDGMQVSLKPEVDQLSGSTHNDHPFRIGDLSSSQKFRGEVQHVELRGCQLSGKAVRLNIANQLRQYLAHSTEFKNPEERSRFEEICFSVAHPECRGQLVRVSGELAAAEIQKKNVEGKLETVMVMEELPEPRKAYVLTRGQYDLPDLDQEVTADTPGFLPPSENASGVKNRLDLANWMVSSENPLTARVAVNRIWQRFFGVGLVKTTEDFGVQSEPPSHPQLLDWLASEFIDSGWDVQHIQRLVASSSTYRQSSRASVESYRRDPDNRLLSRGPRLRLPAEIVRDNALQMSGLLNSDIGGPSVMTYQPEGLWQELAGGASEKFVQAKGRALYRRSIYIYRKRTVPHPTMSTFDAPSWEICQVKRGRTNSPLQALLLLNDVTYVEAARHLGERMLVEAGNDPGNRIAYAFRLATGRQPRTSEREILQERFERYLTGFRKDRESAIKLLESGESDYDRTLDVCELAASTLCASTILNLDETISKN